MRGGPGPRLCAGAGRGGAACWQRAAWWPRLRRKRGGCAAEARRGLPADRSLRPAGEAQLRSELQLHEKLRASCAELRRSAPLPRWLSAARSAASRPERKAWGKVCGGSNRSVRCCGRAAGNADLWVGQWLPCSAAPFRAFCALFVCFFMSVCPVFHFCLLEASEREALTSARSCIE